jgi:hypothetical protein
MAVEPSAISVSVAIDRMLDLCEPPYLEASVFAEPASRNVQTWRIDMNEGR